jgi:hypothetical protein
MGDRAALDPDRLVRVAGSGSTASLKIIGHSEGAGRLRKLWVWSDEPDDSDEWNGGSAAAANDSDTKRYTEENK